MNSDTDQAEVLLERLFLGRALLGDHDAFVVLGSMHSQQVYAIARNLSSSDEDALELMQRAFRKASKQLGEIPAELPFRIFVCRFLVRDAMDRLRPASRPASISLEQFLPRFEDGKQMAGQLSDDAEMNELAFRREIAERIREVLPALAAEDRAAFVLRIIEGLPLQEAAAILEMPASVVRQRANRAHCLMSGCILDIVADRPAANWDNELDGKRHLVS